MLALICSLRLCNIMVQFYFYRTHYFYLKSSYVIELINSVVVEMIKIERYVFLNIFSLENTVYGLVLITFTRTI